MRIWLRISERSHWMRKDSAIPSLSTWQPTRQVLMGPEEEEEEGGRGGKALELDR
jgi:hypothetical protein